MPKRKVSTASWRGRPRVQSVNNEESLTVQSDAHLADIRNILAQYGGIENFEQRWDEVDLLYKDVSEFTDLADALNQAEEAKVQFMKLPSKLRELYQHDVAVWLDTAHDPEKQEAMQDALVEAGFVKIKKEPVVEVVEPVVEPVVKPTEPGEKKVGS